MATLLEDDKAFHTFLRSALERGDLKITKIKNEVKRAHTFQIETKLFKPEVFTVYHAVRITEDDNPVDLVIDKIIAMAKQNLVEFIG